MSILDKMKLYNGLVDKHTQVVSYFDKFPEKFTEENIAKYRSLRDEMDTMVKNIELEGYKVRGEELILGFRQIKYLEKEGLL